MPATYVDQVQKLDIRSLMAAAVKAGRSHGYAVYRDEGAWHPAAGPDLLPSAHQLVARLVLDRAPTKGGARPQAVKSCSPWFCPTASRASRRCGWLRCRPETVGRAGPPSAL